MDKSSNTIQTMFTAVAPNYDKVNTILSLGIHHAWKKKLVDLSQLSPGQTVLDCATGTGDLAVRYKKAVGAAGAVTGVDFCRAMVDQAPAKASKQGLDIAFVWGDVCDLQFDDDTFDCTSIAFGIRNVADVDEALKQMARVTKPEGNVMILEFGQVETPVVKQLYNFYSTRVLPRIGGWISGQTAAYQYLNDSSQRFPSGDAFVELALKTGAYKTVEKWSLSLGVACIYRCKPIAHHI
jgi:demethylmenaquinone methyltransferase/2-methoxy-6-polyprenyl-1,4-benzoquinol methylase